MEKKMTPDKEKTFNNNTHLQFWEKDIRQN